MKDLREYFKLVITAVICFATSLFSGKRNHGKTRKVISLGHAAGTPFVRNSENVNVDSACGKSGYFIKIERRNVENYIYRQNLLFKKVFFWLQGPGDRAWGLIGNIP